MWEFTSAAPKLDGLQRETKIKYPDPWMSVEFVFAVEKRCLPLSDMKAQQQRKQLVHYATLRTRMHFIRGLHWEMLLF